MITILFDCYHDRNEVRLVVQKLLDEGLNQRQISIITPEIAQRAALGKGNDGASASQRRLARRRRLADSAAVERRHGSAATRAVGLADPLVRALARAGLSVDDAVLGAAQARQGATLVLIRPQEQ